MWYINIALLVLHLIVSGLVFLGIRAGILKVHAYMFFVTLLLPLWGLLLVLILHFQIWFKADDSIDVGVERLKLESELYRSVTVDDKKVAATTVPIEEALVINSARDRRTIIMDVLNDNPREYIEFLQKAGNNDDTEVVHYAVTAMSEISKENDRILQDFERRHKENPDDLDILVRYLDFLWSCLSQNLMQGQIEMLNRATFATLIRQKLAAGGEVEDYIRAVENDLRRGQFSMAHETLQDMGEKYPYSEEYYLLKIQYYASLGRGEEIQSVLQEIAQRHIFLSAKAKEVLAFWES